MNALRLYLRYIAISIRSQLQYRASFVMLVLARCVTTSFEILAIWALFTRFRTLGSWRLEEVALLYGLVNIAFALAEGGARGFDTFSDMVRSGDFDRLLLRPRSTALQVAARDFQLMQMGRLLQGLVVLAWSATRLGVHWSAPRIGLVGFAILGGACLFGGLFILQATIAFWATETLEIVNTVTYGGIEAGQYPLPIYQKWFQRFFIFVVPLACVTYFPALAVLGRDDSLLHSPVWFQWIAPSAGLLFMLLALNVWELGVRHYRSTGS